MCTSNCEHLLLFLQIFSTARFINKSDLLELLGDELNFIQFLCNEGLLSTQKLCSECDLPMNLKKLQTENCHILYVKDCTKE
jgi:hypothetical protein